MKVFSQRNFVILLALTLPTTGFSKSTKAKPAAAPALTLAPLLPGHERQQHEITAKKYVITSSGVGASEAGHMMFAKGGNIFDAATAVTFAISVERPQSTGIGGGGFMMIFNPKTMKEPEAVDFREMAPLAATAEMFLKDGKADPKMSLDGIKSVATPGTVAGILEIHKKYGKLPLATVMQPAIDLAENGFKVYGYLADSLVERLELLKASEAASKIFLKDGGKPLVVGDLLVQKDLAKVLREIAAKGKAGFYEGWVRDAILAESKRLGGILTAEDFAGYQVKWRQAVRGKFNGYDIYSMPPPSSGGIHVIEILNILSGFNLRKLGAQSPEAIHLTSAAMQRAFADRAKYLGDTDFAKVPIHGLMSKKYAAGLHKQIAAQKSQALPSAKVSAGDPLPFEHEETTHFSLMDSSGNMIASTQTVNWWMGSGVVVPGTGILLNDEMDDFAAQAGAANAFGAIGGNNNLIAPRKRPLSSMSPTLVTKGKMPVMTVGTPSGTKIITCVTLTLLNYLEYQMPLYDAVAAVRYHHQWQPDEIRFDEPALPKATQDALVANGYKLNLKNLNCIVNAIAKEKNLLHGVADPRSEGLAIGGN